MEVEQQLRELAAKASLSAPMDAVREAYELGREAQEALDLERRARISPAKVMALEDARKAFFDAIARQETNAALGAAVRTLAANGRRLDLVPLSDGTFRAFSYDPPCRKVVSEDADTIDAAVLALAARLSADGAGGDQEGAEE